MRQGIGRIGLEPEFLVLLPGDEVGMGAAGPVEEALQAFEAALLAEAVIAHARRDFPWGL